MTTRRRFLTILAGSTALPLLPAPLVAGTAQAAQVWRGIALGAPAMMVLEHPDAPRLLRAALAEIDRLENLFSLHRDSALTRLNRDGYLPDPPLEMLEILSLAGAVHARTNGAFDPSVQPLWVLYGENMAAGRTPQVAEITATLARTGWDGVSVTPARITLARPRMALTLNGIAQGYIADRVTALFRAAGVENVLVNTGEIAATGDAPDAARGQGWPVRIEGVEGEQHLLDRAIATSAPLGTTFDAAGRTGHILDPRTGRPGGRWQQVSVLSRSAAEADALSTAFCLMTRAEIAAAQGDSKVVLR